MENTKKWVLNPLPVTLPKCEMGLVFWVMVVGDSLSSGTAGNFCQLGERAIARTVGSPDAEAASRAFECCSAHDSHRGFSHVDAPQWSG